MRDELESVSTRQGVWATSDSGVPRRHHFERAMSFEPTMHGSLDGIMQAPGSLDVDRSEGFEHGAWQLPYFDNIAGFEPATRAL
jgi:hypothetical protein